MKKIKGRRHEKDAKAGAIKKKQGVGHENTQRTGGIKRKARGGA